MDRRALLGAMAAAAVAPGAALAEARDKTIPYEPLDTNPYYDPIYELKQQHVDAKIWPAVKLINKSGWVWTAESCQGHQPGWSRVPMIRLVTRNENVGKMLAALTFSQRVGDEVQGLIGEGKIELARHAPAPRGWYEVRVFVRSGGIAVFNRFARAINQGA